MPDLELPEELQEIEIVQSDLDAVEFNISDGLKRALFAFVKGRVKQEIIVSMVLAEMQSMHDIEKAKEFIECTLKDILYPILEISYPKGKLPRLVSTYYENLITAIAAHSTIGMVQTGAADDVVQLLQGKQQPAAEEVYDFGITKSLDLGFDVPTGQRMTHDELNLNFRLWFNKTEDEINELFPFLTTGYPFLYTFARTNEEGSYKFEAKMSGPDETVLLGTILQGDVPSEILFIWDVVSLPGEINELPTVIIVE